MPRTTLAALLAVLTALISTPSAEAHPEYQRAFQDEYTKSPEVDKDYRKLVRTAKCYLCHQGKEDRANYNRYGKALTAHLVEADKKDKEKIAAALTKVAQEPSGGEGSPTFGELITKNELPGGPLEDSKKEPTGG